MKRYVCAVALMALFSCSSEKAAEIATAGGQRPGAIASGAAEPGGAVENARYSLKVLPAEASRRTVLKAVPRGFRAEDARIEWILNGGPVVATGVTFDASATTKGDRVQARALIGDSEVLSETREIRNSPPELVRVKIMPEVFKPGDSLNVEAAAEDADGDDVTIAYEWTKNGEPAGTGKAIESPLKRGDSISIRITPFDGEADGQQVLLKREIRNMPPVINEEYRFKIDRGIWSHKIEAEDPDGDALTYSLKSAPAGMKIDPSDGLVTWDIPRGFQGTATVIAGVKDGQGGEATHTLYVYVNP